MRRWLAALLACAALPAWADLEVLTLRHRPAAELLPVLEPHLAQGGHLSAMGDKLIVNTGAANLAELKRLLETLDRPARQLLISVRHEGDDTRQGAGLGIAVPNEREDDRRDVLELGRARVWGTRELRRDRLGQQVRVSEGGTASISLGSRRPIPLRQVVIGPQGAILSETLVQRELSSGFTARPSLNGDRVSIEISPRRETAAADPLSPGRTSQLSTTLTGRLGEWIPLGGVDETRATEDTASVVHSTRELRRDRRILLKVDEIRE